MKTQIVLVLLAILLAGCSSDPESSPTNMTNEMLAPDAATNIVADNSVEADSASAPAVAPNVLTLEGLGDLKIGAAVPADGSWAERGAQISDSCRTVTSPDFPGVYAIVEAGKVRRISVGKGSDVKLIEGIGVGATEKQVQDAFPGFRAEPHKYIEAPAKYLTAPGAARGDLALRFEIGSDGKVSLMHVGTMPVLGYVEGCA